MIVIVRRRAHVLRRRDFHTRLVTSEDNSLCRRATTHFPSLWCWDVNTCRLNNYQMCSSKPMMMDKKSLDIDQQQQRSPQTDNGGWWQAKLITCNRRLSKCFNSDQLYSECKSRSREKLSVEMIRSSLPTHWHRNNSDRLNFIKILMTFAPTRFTSRPDYRLLVAITIIVYTLEKWREG